MKCPELLAPAGTFECLEAVFSHGADAAYVGVGTFNLRANSFNFKPDELPDAIAFTRSLKKRIYAVLNIMPDDAQLCEIEQCCKEIALFKELPDAFIVSDPGVISVCREFFPGVPLHLSTQTGTFNRRSMEFWASQGIKRVILPRELNLEQITALAKAQICETEVFVHGAMCVAYSGRCLFGAYLSGRHSNHGECPQPCRFKYTISPIGGHKEQEKQEFPVEEDENGIYLMNSKDLNTVSILDSIITTGVTSLKIEGRNKSVHYVSSAVKVYRDAIDSFIATPTAYKVKQEWIEELDRLDHRTYTTGFFKNEYQLQDYSASKAESKVRVVGIVKGTMEGNYAIIDVKNPFSKDETLDVLPVNKKKSSFSIIFDAIADLNDNKTERAITNRIVKVHSEQKLAIGDILRRLV